MENTGQKTN